MSRTRVKICGITRPQDAARASQLGADAIGMVFHPASRRCVSLETARQILAALEPFTTAVGLFVDAPTQTILDTSRALGLDHIQLHGHETSQQVAELHRFAPHLRLFKAIRVDAVHFTQTLDIWRQAIASLDLTNLRGLVLETPSAAPGGTGIPNNWASIAEHQRAGHTQNLPPLIAAGGLTPQNVASVIERIRPFAVDVSSGVEDRPGEKSETKLRAFMAAVQSIGA